jgi:hypothetical protein
VAFARGGEGGVGFFEGAVDFGAEEGRQFLGLRRFAVCGWEIQDGANFGRDGAVAGEGDAGGWGAGVGEAEAADVVFGKGFVDEADGEACVGGDGQGVRGDQHGAVGFAAGGAIDGPAFAAIAGGGLFAGGFFRDAFGDEGLDAPAFLRVFGVGFGEGDVEGLGE